MLHSTFHVHQARLDSLRMTEAFRSGCLATRGLRLVSFSELSGSMDYLRLLGRFPEQRHVYSTSN